MKRSMLILSIFVIIFLGSCASGSPTQVTSPPSEVTSSCTPLDVSNFENLAEVFSGGSPGVNGEVIAVQALPSSDIVMILHIGNPSFIRWKLWDNHPATEMEFGLVSRRAAGFSKSGNLAMGATESEGLQESGMVKDHVGGVLAWDTETGDPVACIDPLCPGQAPSDIPMPTLVGATLDSDGNTALTYNELGVTRVSLPDGKFERIYSNIYPDMKTDDLTTIGFVVLDYSDKRFAVGLEEGQVVVMQLDRPWWNFLNRDFVLGMNDPSDRKAISDMVFSPDGNWLAQARGDNVRLWNLTSSTNAPSIQLSMKRANKLAFDITSRYLIAANSDCSVSAFVRHQEVKS